MIRNPMSKLVLIAVLFFISWRSMGAEALPPATDGGNEGAAIAFRIPDHSLIEEIIEKYEREKTTRYRSLNCTFEGMVLPHDGNVYEGEADGITMSWTLSEYDEGFQTFDVWHESAAQRIRTIADNMLGKLADKNFAMGATSVLYENATGKRLSEFQELPYIFVSGSKSGKRMPDERSMSPAQIDQWRAVQEAKEEKEFYFVDSVGENGVQEQARYFEEIKPLFENFYRMYPSHIRDRLRESDSSHIPQQFMSWFAHSEQALLRYVRQNIQDLIPEDKEASMLIINIMTERDMCRQCQPTVFLTSMLGLKNKLPVVIFVSGGRNYKGSREGVIMQDQAPDIRESGMYIRNIEIGE